MKHLFIYTLVLVSFSGFAQMTGFTPTNQAKQEKLEAAFKTQQSSERFKKHLTTMCSVPHTAGTPENEKVRDYIAETMRKAGLQVEVFPHDIYMPKGPGEISVELVQPIRQPLNNREYILQEDKYSGHPLITPGWNAYSGSGDVTAEVVYANYGRKEDFEQLKAMGVSVQGKIVLARYGGNFRGYKAKHAQAAGAAGVIIYTDPADNGYTKGITFPEGSQSSDFTIQRGSLLTVDFTGDPLTPFEPALPLDGPKKVKRSDVKDVDLHKIPVTPLPWGSAVEILKRMTGKGVPAGWQGGLPLAYRLEGGSELKVRLNVKQEKGFVRTYQIVGTLTGSEFPDEWVISGCHYDAWSFGATDPNSGTAMLLTLSESLGEMAKQGQRPKRTLKICHWDVEEYGVIGSTEWAEQLRDELSTKAVAYMNYDAAVSGKIFGASSSPSLKKLLIEATKTVQYPDSNNSTVYQHWIGQKGPRNGSTANIGGSAPVAVADEPTIGNLGGGSDHIAFYMHLGIPSLGGGTGGPTLYHSQYDDLFFYEKFVDPTYKMGPMVEQVVGTLSLRLANADVLPFDVVRYATDLNTHLQTVEKAIKAYKPDFTVNNLLASVADLKKNAEAYEATIKTQLATDKLDKTKAAALNKELRNLEKSFLDPKGMAYGAWYRSLYASSDPYSGYASWMLPAYMYEASLKSSANLPDLEARHQKAIKTLNDKILAMSQQLVPANGTGSLGGGKN
ncbi:MAG: M28 family peptidase [Runella slithyformis]|nr:MAG: M28 family peptidase [Runella slithyformis]TAF95081.1 MAG: M28 family peptidase [Runella sp.]TAG18415.1 MAG: M28 family peptidase [Cytophagales bacterium]TAG37933.1 MAG: M28 family peptidase [Cytophagia bacterium]TAF83627.1 MAG: M28 family peptidase [Runella slithyformis]